MNVAYDSRPGEVKKIHMDDIVTKSTRICTMDQPSYKEQQISVNPKSKPYKFLSEVMWMVDEVIDHRIRRGVAYVPVVPGSAGDERCLPERSTV